MKQYKSMLIKNNLEKAEEAFKNAVVDLENNLLYGAQNRVYYAIFYTVTALGCFEDFSTNKHTELFGWFNRVMVYEKEIFSRELQQTYKVVYENRSKSDYSFNFKPDKDDLTITLKDARLLIDTIKAYIETDMKFD